MVSYYEESFPSQRQCIVKVTEAPSTTSTATIPFTFCCLYWAKIIATVADTATTLLQNAN